MVNIFPTIKIDISTNSEIFEEIMLGASCSLEEFYAYTDLFQLHNFTWSYTKIPSLDPSIVEHHIDTRLYVAPMPKETAHPSIQSGCDEN